MSRWASLSPAERADRIRAAMPVAAAQGQIERERERDRVAATKAREAEGPRHLPVFRGAALAAQTITKHSWSLSGPSETGKTWSGLYRLDTLMRETPGAKAWLARKTEKSLYGTCVETLKRVIALRGGVSWDGGKKPTTFYWPGGARLDLIGLDNVEKHLSGEKDFIYINQMEEVPDDDLHMLRTRVTGRGAVTKTPMLFGDNNPSHPNHILYTGGIVHLLHSKHEDNPTLFDDDGNILPQGVSTMEILDALPGVLHARLRKGLWVAAEGIVYEEFDLARNVIQDPTFRCSAYWRRIVSIDFGFENPFSASLWAIDGDGTMYLEREVYMSRRTIVDHVPALRAITKGLSIEAWIADPEAAGDRAILRDHGIHTLAAKKDVTAGINRVKARMKPQGPKKRPRILFLPEPLYEVDQRLQKARRPCCGRDEMSVYQWEKSADGKPLKDRPLKLNDHFSDGMRYATAYVDVVQPAKATVVGDYGVYHVDPESGRSWGDPLGGYGEEGDQA